MIGLIARPYQMTAIGPYNGDANFPSSNATNNDYGRVARYTNGGSTDTGVAPVMDLGSSKLIDVIGILWHNVKRTDYQVRVMASDNPDATGGFDMFVPMVTGTTMRDSLGLYKMLLTLPNPITARYVRFDIPIYVNTTTQVSRFFVGKGAQFVIGPQKASLGAKDMNANVTTEVGEQRSQEDPGLIRPVVSLSFEYAKQSEMEQVLGQYTLSLGVSKPMLICTDLTSPYIQDNVAFGRPEKVVQLDSSVYDVWSFDAVVPSLGV